ncbi:MAG: T9SS type A sorting domain-containing protein [Ignavibacteriaceae bacterium]|nr:T9SS type A sorting domain-containing protein [Ignavibacteriaceae bacterium]
MNKTFSFLLNFLVLLFWSFSSLQAQSIEQRLVIVENEQTLNGNFRIQVQVKGTNLPSANTLGSATIDVQFDSTHLAFTNSTLWAFGSALGYSRSATPNTQITKFIRVGVLGTTVNGDGGGDPPGFDIGTTYTSWVQLNFTILNPAVTTSLTVNNTTNAIGLFNNYQNEPVGAGITNQTLTPPENIIDAPLPVELTSFTSKYLNDKVQLNWVTKTEVNNYGFNVERRINDGEWHSIGFVEGHGNSNSPKEYNYADRDLFAGGSIFQYRLKQIDTDGQFEYSDVVEVEVMPTQFELSQNYPNPFNPGTTIRFSLPQASQIKINIYNVIGELVATLADGMYESGYHKIEFNASSLPSGTYIYRITSDSFVQTKKMMLLK